MRRNKQYAFLSAFFNHFSVFLYLLMIFNRSGKFSDLWEVHVDSFTNIWMLLDNVSDLLHDLSVELTKFTDIKIFLWRKYINTETRNWQQLVDNVLKKNPSQYKFIIAVTQFKIRYYSETFILKEVVGFPKIVT